MRLFRYLRVALESIAAHKLRAILTMLGIIIGVAAVLTTMGIGRGAAADITQRIESQGTNLLTIFPGASSVGGLSGGAGSASTLTMGDVEALRDTGLHPTLAQVAPEYSANRGDVGASSQSAALQQATIDYEAAKAAYDIAPYSESESGVVNYPVTIRLTDTDLLGVRPGMAAVADILGEDMAGSWLVPTGAIRERGENTMVMILRDGQPTPIRVTTQGSQGEWTVVQSAELQEGDQAIGDVSSFLDQDEEFRGFGPPGGGFRPPGGGGGPQ